MKSSDCQLIDVHDDTLDLVEQFLLNRRDLERFRRVTRGQC